MEKQISRFASLARLEYVYGYMAVCKIMNNRKVQNG